MTGIPLGSSYLFQDVLGKYCYMRHATLSHHRAGAQSEGPDNCLSSQVSFSAIFLLTEMRRVFQEDVELRDFLYFLQLQMF